MNNFNFLEVFLRRKSLMISFFKIDLQITAILTHPKRSKVTHPVTVQSDPPFGVGFDGVKLGWIR